MINGHLLSVADLTKESALNLLSTAKELAQITDGPNKKLPTLRGKTVVNLFFEDSTRTRISFETAAKRLSADVINFSAKGSSVSKGESLKDTAQTLQAMGADAVVIRHGSSGAAKRLADTQWIQAAVINAGDGTHEHPTQALLDAFTIKQHLRNNEKDLSGVKVLIVGDILHSRVARSNVLLLTKLGAQVTLVAPPTLLPVGVSDWPVKISYDLDDEISKCDVVMMLRIQLERMNDSFFPSSQEYSKRFGLNSVRLAKLSKNAIVMHPGPMNRGLEISAESADDLKSVIIDQVKNGVAIRMAVLYELLGGAPIGEGK
ncbi:aspartate carbamoyltransferase catalytic subunit [Candidatus Nanopelagicus limnes]|jgi:aspartate carbamoyltransferase catalytic subunit|uniref:Aspartate carbamoyltransferase n=1 Tax=Candidatus Nanopelagicus limnae TaxID=1884634 RepID=A0A249JXT4_9ACTN|nr:aspartate carbamoyltransferase catalytic subunit [Candidatus Nanopelagicus limnes]ASY09337.1 aspartate carbamoyltransferase catalytic subunit [Candidatus Nanopelagicus limnes]